MSIKWKIKRPHHFWRTAACIKEFLGWILIVKLHLAHTTTSSIEKQNWCQGVKICSSSNGHLRLIPQKWKLESKLMIQIYSSFTKEIQIICWLVKTVRQLFSNFQNLKKIPKPQNIFELIIHIKKIIQIKFLLDKVSKLAFSRPFLVAFCT